MRPARLSIIGGVSFSSDLGGGTTQATRITAAIAIVALLLMQVASEAADLKAPGDSSWASFRKTPNLTGVAVSQLPAKLDLLWQVELGEQIVASAAIVGEHVYVPCLSGELVCLERSTGKRVWTYKSVEKVEKNTFAPGFKAAPLVTADSVYAGDEDGVFHAIDRNTGVRRWQVKTGGEIFGAANILDGRILFGSYDNSLYCVADKDGEVKWRFQTEGYVHCTRPLPTATRLLPAATSTCGSSTSKPASRLPICRS